MNRSSEDKTLVKLSPFDRFISRIDRQLKVFSHSVPEEHRETPKSELETHPDMLSVEEKQFIGGLMRVNHTGEVCAQALYKGQAITARKPDVQRALLDAADEESDHLAWCEERLDDLGTPTSRLNPAFYGLSFLVGAVTGLMGDKVSLGFVAETEKQVGQHLTQHLNQIPYKDKSSRAILEQMRLEEEKHGSEAIERGGVELPMPVKLAMRGMAKVMKSTTFRF